MLFRRFFERRQRERAASDLYLSAVAQARQPAFYAQMGVPDTLEGRYDMIILHVWMIMRRLGRVGGEAAEALSRSMVELMFADMDRNLREMGVTDLRVGKRVLNMAEAFYGRASAYDRALAEDEAALAAALERNVYQSGTPLAGQPACLAVHVRAQLADLDSQDGDSLCGGKVLFQQIEVQP